ncbi:MAG: hypothetical protein ACREHD_16985, partial [Pirellulales bacterium]
PQVPRLSGTFDLTVMPATEDAYELPPAAQSKALAKLSSSMMVNLETGAIDIDILPPALRAAVATRAKSPPKPRGQQATWRQALKEFAFPEQTAARLVRAERLAPAKQRLFYRINLAELRGAATLKIEFVKRTLKRNGELGVSTLWSLDADAIETMSDPADRELLALLLGSKSREEPYGYRYYYRSSSGSSSCEIADAAFAVLLPRLAATGRLGWVPGADPRHEEIQLLRWDDGPPWKFKLSLSPPEGKSGRKLVAKLFREGEEAKLNDVYLAFTGLVMFSHSLARLDSSVLPQMVGAARRLGEVHIPAGQEDKLVEEIWKSRGLPPIELPDDLKWEQLHPEPRPRVQIGPVKIGSMTWLIGKLAFDYDGQIVDGEDERQMFCDGNGRRILHRDRRHEEAALKELFRLSATPTSYAERYYGSFKVARKDFAPLVVALNEAGWHVEAEGHRLRRPGTTHVSLASGVDWFELDGHVDYEGEQVGLPKLLEALRRGEDFVTLGDGSRGMLPSE